MSDDKRDRYTPKHRSSPYGVPAVEVFDEATGMHERGEIDDDELERRRKKRPTDARVGRLETKHDDLVKTVTATREEVKEMRGELKILPRMLELLETGHTARVDVHKAERLDTIDAKRTRRGWITTAVGGLFTGGLIITLLERCT